MTYDDRMAGTMLGLATADALGAGYELQPPPSGDIGMIGGGLGDFAPGQWTDDTAMAVGVARVLAAGNAEVDLAAIGEQFLEWAYSDPAGNGALMRTAPVALAFLGDDERMSAVARDVACLTHADPLAGDSCVLWCIGIDRAVREQRLDGVEEGIDLLPAARRDRWVRHLQDAVSQPASGFAPNGTPWSLPYGSGTTRTRWPPSPGHCWALDGARPRYPHRGVRCSTAGPGSARTTSWRSLYGFDSPKRGRHQQPLRPSVCRIKTTRPAADDARVQHENATTLD